eukprot:TRINITY_DN6019_c0_g1_i1.p1 TRINITY_DN6019_c0_g1~~TRINITY_DN6019_c0_g1_i1.p1  ORF type:complete len:167 (-),score=25.99 TRINITY_DN6019_c0_g1_i1:81-581(-)
MQIVVVLLSVFFALCIAQGTQPPITFVNYYKSAAPLLICSIDIDGAPGDQYTINPPNDTEVYNITITPTTRVGKYHLVPSNLYNCAVLYQPYPTYAVSAVGAVVNGIKYVSLLINQYAQGYPQGLEGIYLMQNSTLKTMCTNNGCGGASGSVLVAIPAEPFSIYIK